MPEIELKVETCPHCGYHFKDSENGNDDSTTSYCPKCKREFTDMKIRFL